jgi:hypothetical protein
MTFYLRKELKGECHLVKLLPKQIVKEVKHLLTLLSKISGHNSRSLTYSITASSYVFINFGGRGLRRLSMKSFCKTASLGAPMAFFYDAVTTSSKRTH